MTDVSAGRWTRTEGLRLPGMVGVIALIHLVGWSLYLYYATSLTAAVTFAGAGTLAYTLGVRHAFDADHMAAIDDTTRLMPQRGRRSVGVGFSFALDERELERQLVNRVLMNPMLGGRAHSWAYRSPERKYGAAL